jgi:hypothetical protein
MAESPALSSGQDKVMKNPAAEGVLFRPLQDSGPAEKQ